MAYPTYYVEAGDTLPVLFDTFAGATGASITMTGLAVTDIEVYKDGGVTQRASDAGYALLDTDGIDFDGITGIHGFSIDLSNDADPGFYAVGPWYHVVVSAITVDAQTVSFVACAFRIVSATRGLAGTALPNAAADAAGGLPISDAGGLDLDARLDAAVSSRAAATVCTEARLAELDAANLPTDVAGVQSDTDNLQTRLPAALVGGRMAANAEVVGDKTGYALTVAERNSIAAALLDLANGIETGVTPRQAARQIAATAAGILSGAGTGLETVLGLDDATTRAVYTVSAAGNRTAVARTLG